MAPNVAMIARILTLLTLLTDIGIVLYLLSAILSVFLPPVRRLRTAVLKSLAPNARVMAFTVAMVAMLGSLFYSEVAKFTPCILCWYQRILMYPQTLLIGMGIIKKDKDVADYAIGFSVAGGLIALYHYWIQVGGTEILPCSAVGYSVSCSNRFSLEYGYITIPMMSLTAFTAIILLMIMSKSRKPGPPSV